MKKTTKLLLAALAVCVLAAAVAAASLTVSAANEKTGMFNGSPADVDEAGNLLLNSTNFPDEKFLTYVSDFDKDGDGTLSVDEVAKVERIDVRDAFHTLVDTTIKNLSGTCYFTSLTYLDCAGNALKELDVSKCTELTQLKCTGNNLSELDVSKCTKLTSLECWNNDFVELDVSRCTELTRLYCSDNNIAELDVSGCTKLSDLNCDGNNLSELDVSKCTELTYLYCSDNNIAELDVSKCTKLKSLECENNRITKIDLSACPDIDTALLGQYVNISDIKMNEKAEPKYMSLGVNSYFDKDENVYKVDYAECLDYINFIAKKWHAEGVVEPFKRTEGAFEEHFNDGSYTNTSWYDSWYIDSDEDEIDYDGEIINASSYKPNDGRTYYWPSYKDGAFVGISLNEHPELSDYYKESISCIAYEIWGIVDYSGKAAVDHSIFDLILYITPEPVLSDSDSNVTAEYPKEEQDDYAGVSFNAESITEGEEYKAAEKAVGEDYTGFIPYSLTLTDKDGKPVSVKSSMTVKVPVPEGWEAGKTLVFYVDGDGKATDMKAVPSEDGKSVTFSTTHFSTYVLVNAATKKDAPTTDKPGSTKPTPVPPTGDTSPAVPAAVTLVLSAACIFLVSRRRKDDDK